MSKAWTIGTPADIMVASWRAKIAMSLVVIFCLRLVKIELLFLRTLIGVMPWRRISARASAIVAARDSPLMRLPLRSVPSQVKTRAFSGLGAAAVAAFVAML